MMLLIKKQIEQKQSMMQSLKLEVRYNNALEKNILDMDGEAGPKINSQKHEQLLVQYAGDDDALSKIKTVHMKQTLRYTMMLT